MKKFLIGSLKHFKFKYSLHLEIRIMIKKKKRKKRKVKTHIQPSLLEYSILNIYLETGLSSLGRHYCNIQ